MKSMIHSESTLDSDMYIPSVSEGENLNIDLTKESKPNDESLAQDKFATEEAPCSGPGSLQRVKNLTKNGILGLSDVRQHKHAAPEGHHSLRGGRRNHN